MAKLTLKTKEQLHFLFLEINEQLAIAEAYFIRPSPLLASRIKSRAGYLENLRNRTRRSLLAQLKQQQSAAQHFQLQATDSLVSLLHYFSQLCRESVLERHNVALSSDVSMPDKECSKLLKRLNSMISELEKALLNADSRLALSLDKERKKIHLKLNKTLERFIVSLREKHPALFSTESIFAFYAIRQMLNLTGDMVAAVLSANLGQKTTVARLQSLGKLADNMNAQADNLQLDPLAETRSGSVISGISHKADSKTGQPEYFAVFKEGEKQKVREEKQSVQSWHQIFPGLAPKIIAYKKQGSSASMLIEHLPGITFEHLLTQPHRDREQLCSYALEALLKTLKKIWLETKVNESIGGQYMAQLKDRLNSVYQVHPKFNTQTQMLCNEQQISLNQLIERANEFEKQWQAPFSVYIHGDFNLDNIIYDPVEKKINFIDLHRSQYMDYVQDISVFIISIYRLNILETDERARIMSIAKAFLTKVRRFAKQQNDASFELRLSLGLARSLITSTRFILDPVLSKRMVLRARYLLDCVTNLPNNNVLRYKTPLKELFVE